MNFMKFRTHSSMVTTLPARVVVPLRYALFPSIDTLRVPSWWLPEGSPIAPIESVTSKAPAQEQKEEEENFPRRLSLW